MAAMVAITLTAFGLRLISLGQWSLWIDEALSIRDSLALGSSQPILTKFHFLYYVVLKPFLMVLGTEEWSARLPSVIAGTISIPVMYFCGKSLFGWRLGLLSAILLAIAPWHIFWSQNARFYAQLLLLYNAALFLGFRAIEEDHWGLAIWSTVLAGLAIVTHPTGAFYLPIVVAYGLITLRRQLRRNRRSGHKYLVPMVVLPLLYLSLEAARVNIGQATAVAKLEPFFGGASGLHSLRLGAGVVAYLGVPLVVLAASGGIFLLVARRREGLFLTLSVLIPLPALLVPVSFPRYVFLSLPSWIILAAFAVLELFRQLKDQGRILAGGVLFVLLTDALSQTYLYFAFQNGNRSNWKAAFSLVADTRREGDLVAATWVELGNYYLEETVLPVSDLDPIEIISLKRRMWIVDDGWVNPELETWLMNHGMLVDELDVSLPGKTLEMNVYLYDPLTYHPAQ